MARPKPTVQHEERTSPISSPGLDSPNAQVLFTFSSLFLRVVFGLKDTASTHHLQPDFLKGQVDAVPGNLTKPSRDTRNNRHSPIEPTSSVDFKDFSIPNRSSVSECSLSIESQLNMQNPQSQQATKDIIRLLHGKSIQFPQRNQQQRQRNLISISITNLKTGGIVWQGKTLYVFSEILLRSHGQVQWIRMIHIR